MSVCRSLVPHLHASVDLVLCEVVREREGEMVGEMEGDGVRYTERGVV